MLPTHRKAARRHNEPLTHDHAALLALLLWDYHRTITHSISTAWLAVLGDVYSRRSISAQLALVCFILNSGPPATTRQQ
jgi:membrane-bound metal-dependent hydrolase YbcI (DUF457 family)